MKEEVGANLTCEVCKKAPARTDDILCLDCSRAYVILLKLLYEHPELAEDDVRRVAEVFEWRMKRTAASEPEAKAKAIPL